MSAPEPAAVRRCLGGIRHGREKERLDAEKNIPINTALNLWGGCFDGLPFLLYSNEKEKVLPE